MSLPPIPDGSTQLVPATDFGSKRIAELLTRAYAGYAIDLHFTSEFVDSLVAVQSVDLDASGVLVRDGSELGLGLVARRGTRERLAAFGIFEEQRRRGLGDRLGRALVKAARARGAREMELEVLAQNVGAVALYRRLGFSVVQSLLGFERAKPAPGIDEAGVDEPLTAVPLTEVAAAVAGGRGAFPWQIAPETIVGMPELRGVRVGGAYAAVREKPDGALAIFALAPERGASDVAHHAQAQDLVKQLSASAGEERLVAPPLFPESRYRVHFEALGFEVTELSQFHMVLPLI